MNRIPQKDPLGNLDETKPETFEKTLKKVTIRKNRTIILSRSYQQTNLDGKDKIALNLKACGSKLKFGEDKKTGRNTLIAGLFCQKRLCPMCAWRRSVRVRRNMKAIVSEPEFQNVQFIFLTLTVRNCPPAGLPDTLDWLFKTWNSLTSSKRAKLNVSFLGTFRALEVTYHYRRVRDDGTVDPFFDTYHPHFHILAAVSPQYFAEGSKLYLSHDALMKLWRKALNRVKRKDGTKYPEADYDPSVDIRKVYEAEENTRDIEDIEYRKAMLETTKYVVKATDYIDKPEVVQVLDPALHRRRLIAFGGLFKKVRDRLKLADEDIAEADAPEDKTEEDVENPLFERLLTWNFGAHCYEVEILKNNEETVNLAAAAREF